MTILFICRVFGSASRQHVRNVDEVDHVTNTSLVDQVFSDGSETDWKEPSLSSYNPRMLQTDVFDKVTFAVHLLQSDACVQVQFMVYDSCFNKETKMFV